jgi:hypothetical protein
MKCVDKSWNRHTRGSNITMNILRVLSQELDGYLRLTDSTPEIRETKDHSKKSSHLLLLIEMGSDSKLNVDALVSQVHPFYLMLTWV